MFSFLSGCAPPILTNITEGSLSVNASFYEVGDELVYQCNQNYSLRMATTRCENSSAGVFQFTLDMVSPPPACILSKLIISSKMAALLPNPLMNFW